MATAVGDLVINLLAKNKASGPIGAVGESLKRLGGMLAGIAGVGGFGLMVREQFKAIDATAKLADRLGTTTQELAGLSHAADLAGSSQETLGRSLQFLSKSLGEASTGVGEAGRALSMLGLSVEDLLGKNPAEQFRVIAEAVSHLSSQEQKAYAATKLFGRAGVELLNTLEMGTSGLDQVQAEVEALGGAFSRFDAAKVEAANDAMTRLKLAAKGGFQQIAIGIAPAVKAVADGLAPALATVGKLFSSVLAPMESTIRFALKLAAGFVAVKAAALLASVATKTYAVVTVGIAVAMKAYTTVMTAITLAMEIYRATTSKAAAATVFLQLLASPAGWIKVGAAIAIATGAILAMDRAMSSASASTQTSHSALADVSDTAPGIDRVADAVGTLGDNAEEARNKLASLKETLGVSLLSGLERLSDAERLGQALEAAGMDVFGRGQALPPSYAAVVLELESLVTHFGSASSAVSAYQRALDNSQSPLEAYEQKLADIDALQQLIGESAANALRADALADYDRALGGPQQKFRDMADELARLRAGADEFEWQLQKWEAAGVSGVDGMRAMREEIDRLNEAEQLAGQQKQEQEKDFAKQALRGSAATKGSPEFYSRIFAAMDGGKGNPANATAENTKAMKSDLARMREGIDEMRRGKVKMVTIEEAAG